MMDTWALVNSVYASFGMPFQCQLEQVHTVQTVKSNFVICASTESLQLRMGIDALCSEDLGLSIIVSAQLLQISVCTHEK